MLFVAALIVRDIADFFKTHHDNRRRGRAHGYNPPPESPPENPYIPPAPPALNNSILTITIGSAQPKGADK